MPGKYGMKALILVLKEVEVKVESIPVHMYQVHNATKHMKYKG